MKKVISVLMAVFMLVALTSCKADNTQGAAASSDENSVQPALTDANNSEDNKMQSTKILVAYFSCTGTTKPLAEYVADSLNADLYEITPVIPYTSADLSYNDSNSRTSTEMNDPDSRPEISGSVENMEQYDIIFLAYPIWWGQAPRILSTFVESYNLSGKTIIPFCTSGSSDIGSSTENLEKLTSGAKWLSGKRFSGGTSRNEMVSWVNSLGLDVKAE